MAFKDKKALAGGKPLLIEKRPLNYFEDGEKVVWIYEKIVPATYVESEKIIYRFMTGTVRNEFEYAGKVGIDLDLPIKGKSHISIGCHRPEVMHHWEFKYFQQNHDYLKDWLLEAYASYSHAGTGHFDHRPILGVFIT